MSHKTDPKIELLAQVSLFRGCTREELQELARICTEIDVPADQVLCREGQVGRECFVVVDGSATVTSGGEAVAMVGPGGFFGEIALLEHGPRVATVTAATPMRLFALSRPEFAQLMVGVPTVSRRIVEALGARLRTAETQRHPSAVGV